MGINLSKGKSEDGIVIEYKVKYIDKKNIYSYDGYSLVFKEKSKKHKFILDRSLPVEAFEILEKLNQPTKNSVDPRKCEYMDLNIKILFYGDRIYGVEHFKCSFLNYNIF